jgi:hypothetical protein
MMGIYGNFIGIIHVRVWVSIRGSACFALPGTPTCAFGWYDMADQEANVQPGFGFVSVNNAVGQYANVIVQIGTNLQIQAQTGVSCSVKPTNAPQSVGFSTSCGWLLRIRNYYATGNTIPAGWSDVVVPDFSLQNYVVPVSASWFVAGKQNVYIVQLFNSMDLASWTQFATVDNATKAPAVTSVTYNPPGPWSIGQQVQINATGASNPNTGLPIVSFGFVCSQGSRFILNANVSATALGGGLYGATAVFTVYTDKLPVQCQVTNFDGQRNGAFQPQFTVVKNANYNNNPPCPPGWVGTYPSCVPGGSNFAVPPALLWAILGLIIGGFAVFLVGKVLSLDPILSIIVQLAGIVLLASGFALGGFVLITWLQALIGSWKFPGT